MKRFLILSVLALLVLLAGTASISTPLAVHSAKAVCPGGPNPNCGGSSCSFDVTLPPGYSVQEVCDGSTAYRFLNYTTSGVTGCHTTVGFYSHQDVRCSNVSMLIVPGDGMYDNYVLLINATNSWVRFVGYAQA